MSNSNNNVNIHKLYNLKLNENSLDLIYQALGKEDKEVRQLIDKNRFESDRILNPLIAKSNHLNNIMNQICDLMR